MGKEYVREIVVLGSVPSLGPVALFDDMEGLFKWIAGGTAGDRVVEKSTADCYNGTYALRCKSRVTGAALGDAVSASRYFPPCVSLKYQEDFLFRLVESSFFDTLTVNNMVDNGVIQRTAGVRYDRTNGLWRYYDVNAVWTAIPGGGQYFYSGKWNRVVVKFDMRTGKYISLSSNGLFLDMSSLSMRPATTTGWSFGIITIDGVTDGVDPCEFYVDDVLILEV